MPIVYLHGCPDSRLTRPPRAAVAGARIIAVDRPGYGASDSDVDGDEATQADDLVSLLDALGNERACILGWSSGGPGALAIGARHPERVRAIGVAAGQVPIDADDDLAGALDPVVAMRTETMRDMTAEQFAATVAPLLAPLDAPLSLHAEAITEGKDAAYLADLASVPGLHDQLALGAMAAVERGLGGCHRDLRAMVSPWPFALADVTVPVVLWYGTEDRRFLPPCGQWLADRLPDARLDVCDGASHLLPLVHWERLVNELITIEGDHDAPQP